MTPISAVKRRTKAPQAAALLAAACQLVQQGGLAALALRPLAQALGVSVTVLSHHYGSRAQVLSAICHSGQQADQAWQARWRTALTPLPAPLPAALAANLVESLFDELAESRAAVTLLQLEVMHGSRADPAWQPGWQVWRHDLEQFWNDFGCQLGLAGELLDSGWWLGYIMTELAYGLTLAGDSSYRMLRRLCLARLFAGGVAGPQAADTLWFAHLQQSSFAPVAAPPVPASNSPQQRTAPWQQAAARCCGELLAERGASALTHRAVASAIGIPHTSLSYRYPTQHALVLLGLDFVSAHILAAVQADSLPELERRRQAGDGHKLDLARASFALALAALRMPELQRRNAAMRGWRGSNLIQVLEKTLPGRQPIDRLSAHVVSLGLLGVGNMAAAGPASEAALAAAFAAALRWLERNSPSLTHSA
ncbi:TetR family transcriptional regulator [Pseudoduganella danionis]|uniref:TetR family transcriptional regulator n=1 Tax=Pseudoduganella danionis TaxID=1890295 RepID=UPI0035AF87A5